MKSVEGILFVCTGNLCRSVMAEGILKKILERKRMAGIRVSSAGTWGLEGNAAAPDTIAVCLEHDVDVSAHRARKLTREIIQGNDLVVVMEMDHLERVIELEPEALDRVRMLSEYGETGKRRYASITDPYMKGKKKFEACFDLIARYVSVLAEGIE